MYSVKRSGHGSMPPAMILFYSPEGIGPLNGTDITANAQWTSLKTGLLIMSLMIRVADGVQTLYGIPWQGVECALQAHHDAD
jgi:hypothetical protein